MREHSGEFLCLRWVWVDVGIDPYELFSGLSEEPGGTPVHFQWFSDA